MQPERNLNSNPVPRSPEDLRNLEPVLPSSGATHPSSPSAPVQTPPEYNSPPPPPPRRIQRFEGWPSIFSTLTLFLLAPVIALSIAAFVVQSYQVDGQSMETTLQNNDRLIVDKWPRSWARLTGHEYVPKRGNIIIFNQTGLDFAGGGSKQLIKRVVGLPGERIVVSGGNITIFNREHPDGFDPDKSGIYHISATVTPGEVDQTLKAGEIFVCGDNRTNSEDSRYFGPVKLNQIVGKLSFRIIPLGKAQRF
ncbi:MAG TPA: signal peptidase I [Candidatus Saccharimonadales bacterium]|nr:signal peptidase I [Candidatus Saccharimonadales bacterium]